MKVDNHSLFFGPQSENMTPQELEDGLFRGKMFTAMVQLKGVYFFKKQVGLTWTVTEAKIYEPKKKRGGPDPSWTPAVTGDSWADQSEQPPKLQSFAFKLK
jgi:hypothetical protein